MTGYYLSFDIEDWFHSHNLRSEVDWDSWDEYELRVIDSTERILDILDNHDTKATFFILGYVADRAPELVAEIDERGHEIASHGYNHELLYDQTEEQVRTDIERSVDVLSSITGQPIRGYRAPSFSITKHATEVLSEYGIEYDSSCFPAPAHDRYGTIEVTNSNTFTTTETGIKEAQLPLLNLGVKRIPWAGGGYFRFIPYSIYRRGVKRISEHRDFIFYFHPWELDQNQPRMTDVPLPYRVRHYTNISRTEERLKRLVSEFDWEPIGTRI
jgi:polysaccharide deacetylase family protein (PEP-CTERM system associated)